MWFAQFLKSKLVQELQFDDMETFEHTKFKPVSIPIAVEKSTRLILGFRVARMPAKGLLAEKARKKYGLRSDDRQLERKSLLLGLQGVVTSYSLIESDDNPNYKPIVSQIFPKATHQTFAGRQGCVVGQGELKSGGFDPLFSLNHTCAMLRANINRLFRRTWCTTKKLENLVEHIWIYAQSHNKRILLNLQKSELLHAEPQLN